MNHKREKDEHVERLFYLKEDAFYSDTPENALTECQYLKVNAANTLHG